MVFAIGSMNNRFIGLSTDAKPSGLEPGATFLEYDTQNLFIFTGAVWTLKQPASLLTKTKLINLKQAAGNYDLFTVNTQDVFVDFLTCIVPADLTEEATFTGISIQSTDVVPVVFVSSTTGAKAKLTEGVHLQYSGPATVAATKKIQLTIIGGATAKSQNCLVFVSYRPVVAGGYLA